MTPFAAKPLAHAFHKMWRHVAEMREHRAAWFAARPVDL